MKASDHIRRWGWSDYLGSMTFQRHLLPRGLGLTPRWNAAKGWRQTFRRWLIEPELSNTLDSMRGELRQVLTQQQHVYVELQHLHREISKKTSEALDGIDMDDLNRAVNGFGDVQERLARLEGRRR